MPFGLSMLRAPCAHTRFIPHGYDHCSTWVQCKGTSPIYLCMSCLARSVGGIIHRAGINNKRPYCSRQKESAYGPAHGREGPEEDAACILAVLKDKDRRTR